MGVIGVGRALPSTVVENSRFEELGVSDEWIRTRTGIEQRRWLGEGETLLALATRASQEAIDAAGLAPGDIDFVFAATSTADQFAPGLAPEIASELGIGHVGALDVSVACSGFLYALDAAISRVRLETSTTVLVVGADAMSRLLDDQDPKSAPLFGDGAGAVVVSHTHSGRTPAFEFGSDGARASMLNVARSTGLLSMDGRDVYTHAVERMSGSLDKLLSSTATSVDDVRLLVCHQANERITKAVARTLQWPAEKCASYISRIGNTSAASIPISLSLAHEEGRLTSGDTLAMAAFGAGYNWGSALVSWQVEDQAVRHSNAV